MELREALHQIQGGDEGALGRPPGVGHRPEPGEIEMGMAQHLERSTGGGLGVGAAPLPSQGRQGRQGGGQQTVGIAGIEGFEFQPAVDQGAVVVAGTAQIELQLQGFAGPPALGQGPATGGIEQIAAVDRFSVDAQLHRLGPPAQTEPGHRLGGAKGAPGLRAGQGQSQPPPLAAPGPDDQAAGRPVGPMDASPGILEGRQGDGIPLWH